MNVAAPPSVAHRLQLGPGEPVVFIERLRYLGDLPLRLDMTYLAPDIGREVLEHSLEINDVFALIEQVTGRRLGGAGLAVESVAADAHSAAILQVPDGAPRPAARAPHPSGRRPTRRPRVHPYAR